MTLSGAQMTAYIGGSKDFEWDYLIEDLQELGMELGMNKSSRWEDREVLILLEGNGAEVGIAEYGGVVSLGIRTEMEDDPSAARWIDKNGPDLVKLFHSYGDPIRSVGTFSNGETVYEKK